MKKKLFPMVACLLVLFMTACGGGKTYEEALAAKDSGDYETALELFQSIEDYKDSAEQIQSINDTLTEIENQNIYDEALTAQKEYDYDRAIELLNKIAGFKDSDALLKTAEEEAFQEKMATYIFNMIRDGSFYNPSAVRLLDGLYEASENAGTNDDAADGVIYITIQGTNKLGGTVRKGSMILVGGNSDGDAYTIPELDVDSESENITELDIGFINKMLAYYWEELGIA